MTDFPVLDAPRTEANTELGRQILSDLGALEPHIDETDSCCTLPIRLAHNQAAGLCIELGPYDLDHNDINTLREAIRAYDTATNGTTLRRIK